MAEFTLTDGSQSNSSTATSLLTSAGGPGLVHADDAILMLGVMPASLSATKKNVTSSFVTRMSQQRHRISSTLSSCSLRSTSSAKGYGLGGGPNAGSSGLKCLLPGSYTTGTFSPSDDEDSIEEQILLMPAAYGAGAIEHDLTSLYRPLTEGNSQENIF